MTTSGAIDVPLQTFGSFCPELPSASLPAGLSPNCQDVEYIRGGVKTRAGLFQQFQLSGNPTVNYLKSYITPSLVLRMLALDSLGNVYKETPIGTLSTVIGTVAAGSFGKSATCFGREYMAFGDGLNGIDIPRQYDDTNFDRVSQVGPGRAPSVTDETATVATTGETQPAAIAIVAAPNGVAQAGFLVTITTTGVHGLVVGQNVVIAGVGVAGYNNGGANPAFFTVVAVPSTTTFTYVVGASGLANSGGGTVSSCLASYTTAANHGLSAGQLVTTSAIAPGGYNVGPQAVFSVTSPTVFTLNLTVAGLGAGGAGLVTNNGSIIAGVHEVSVLFVTRQGYLTAPAPFTKYTAVGAKRAAATNIAIGPPNVVARILIFTASGGANFFYTGPQSPLFSGSMIINDNTTTSTTVDFTDAVLLSGINADALFNLVELGECSGVIDYADRMFWWGERNRVNNFNNLSFDGGTIAPSLYPLGWTIDPVNGAGGSTSPTAVWGQAYAINGDGVSATLGMITQSAFQDYRGVPILLPNTQYSVRVRLNRHNGPIAGNIHIDLQSTSLGITTAGLVVAFGAIPAGGSLFGEFIATIVDFATQFPVIPSDLVLRVYETGAFNAGSAFIIDCIEVFPTNTPYNSSTVRASYNVAANANLGPESFDGVTGLISPQPFDGQAIRSMFKIREFLYIVKERSLYVTQDDGVNEPASWSIHQVSASVGTPSVNGVAVGEDWAVIANRKGLYMFTGGEPQKISQEVQSNQTDIALAYFWDNVNWSAAQFLWTVVDEQNKRIYIGLPFGEAVSPNGVFYLDYRPLASGEDIISGAPIHTSYSGKTINYERSRKWAPWNVRANCAAVVERSNGTGVVFLGSGSANGQIWSLSQSQLYDNINGVQTAINSFYTPYGFPSHDEEEGLQLGSHKKDFTYLTSYVTGAGLLSVNFYPENPAAVAQQLASWTLSAATTRDHEQQLGGGITAERGFFQFSTNAVGSFFKMQKFVPSLRPSVIPLRGVS